MVELDQLSTSGAYATTSKALDRGMQVARDTVLVCFSACTRAVCQPPEARQPLIIALWYVFSVFPTRTEHLGSLKCPKMPAHILGEPYGKTG